MPPSTFVPSAPLPRCVVRRLRPSRCRTIVRASASRKDPKSSASNDNVLAKLLSIQRSVKERRDTVRAQRVAAGEEVEDLDTVTQVNTLFEQVLGKSFPEDAHPASTSSASASATTSASASATAPANSSASGAVSTLRSRAKDRARDGSAGSDGALQTGRPSRSQTHRDVRNVPEHPIQTSSRSMNHSVADSSQEANTATQHTATSKRRPGPETGVDATGRTIMRYKVHLPWKGMTISPPANPVPFVLTPLHTFTMSGYPTQAALASNRAHTSYVSTAPPQLPPPPPVPPPFEESFYFDHTPMNAVNNSQPPSQLSSFELPPPVPPPPDIDEIPSLLSLSDQLPPPFSTVDHAVPVQHLDYDVHTPPPPPSPPQEAETQTSVSTSAMSTLAPAQSAEAILSKLNDGQRAAVIAEQERACLVLAGPGSGKTRVLTHRIAYLIEVCGVSPTAILAVTFTNKAANEMQSRVQDIVTSHTLHADQPWSSADRLVVGTFHSVCARFLRFHGLVMGIPSDFQICNTGDARIVLSRVIKRAEGASPEQAYVRMVGAQVSKLKGDRGDEMQQSMRDFAYRKAVAWRKLYDEELRYMNMLDFDDLLSEARRLLQSYPDVREYLQRKYPFVLVDEWQDTNNVQFDIVSILAEKSNNLFVVGDDDQSIYGFRGANSRNIERYRERFPDAQKVILGTNYRSTENIVSAAQDVIKQDKKRPEKHMVTLNATGEKVKTFSVVDGRAEGQLVVGSIMNLQRRGSVDSFSDCAILYRTNAQSRLLEEAFVQEGIPYILQAGTRFFERREVKDVLAYLRLLNNSSDDNALLRIINVPPRRIGERTVELVEMYARQNGLSHMAAIEKLVATDTAEREKLAELGIKDVTLKRVEVFHSLMSDLRTAWSKMEAGQQQEGKTKGKKVSSLIKAIRRITKYDEFLRDESKDEFDYNKLVERQDNLDELERAASKDDDAVVFLQRAAMMSNPVAEEAADKAEKGAVRLMTMHSGKGLEFEAVFITGVEDGMMPLTSNRSWATDLEEERRLLYVAMTRAKRFLTMTWRTSRMARDDGRPTRISRFLQRVSNLDHSKL